MTQDPGRSEQQEPARQRDDPRRDVSAEEERPTAQTFLGIVKLSFMEWLGEGVMHWGAALSYYTLFSLGPVLIFLVGTAGMFFDDAAAREQILSQLRLLLGSRGAEIADTILVQATFPGFGSVQALLSLLALLVGATAVFGNIQGALNDIWHVKPVTGTVRNALRTRLMAFVMILVLGGLVFLSFLVSAATSLLAPFIEARLPGGSLLVRALDFGVSTALLWLVFAAVYQVLPDARIAWRDVWVGGLVTAVLFAIGKLAIGGFLGRRDPGSVFGAAGSLFALLIWIYYSAQIFLVGASFTEVWARSRGRAIRPEPYAGRVVQRVVPTR